MAIPEPFVTPRMEDLQSKARDYFTDDGFNMQPLKKSDHLLIGQYIQLCNFAELNLRRLARLFRHHEKMTSSQYKKSAPEQLCKTVLDCMSKIGEGNDYVKDATANLNEIAYCIRFRNIFAHWSACRIPGEDAFYFMSMADRDAKQVQEETPLFDELQHAICEVESAHALAQRLNASGEWVAREAARVYELLHNGRAAAE